MEIQDEHFQKIALRRRNYSYQNECVEIGDVKVYQRKRYFVASFIFLGGIIINLMRTSMSITIVDLTSNKTVIIGNETFVKEAEFNWSSKEKGIILSTSPLGCLTAPLTTLAMDKYGSIQTLTASIAIAGVLTVLTPFILSWSTTLYLVTSTVKGIFEGLQSTAELDVLRLWSIPSERNRIFSVVPSHAMAGTMLGHPIFGTIIHILNWKAAFYIIGGFSLIWSIIWFFSVSTPEKDKLITTKERRYIQEANKHVSTQKIIYPWKKIFKSKAVWAYLNDRFVEGWSSNFLEYCLPLYIKDIHDVNIQEIGLICGIPQFCGLVGVIPASILADYLRKNEILSPSNVHKLYLSFSQIVAIVLLISTAFWRNFIANIIFFGIFRLCFSCAMISYMVLPVDMTGQYASIIFAFGGTCFHFGAVLNPIVMGVIVSYHSRFEWSIYFMVISAFNLWGAIIFYKFGSGNLQPWANLSDNSTTDYNIESEKMSTSNAA